jgi:TPR repeat protein
MAGITVCAAIVPSTSMSLSGVVASNIVTGFCGIAEKAFGVGDLVFEVFFVLIIAIACVFFTIRLATGFLLIAMGVLETRLFVREYGRQTVYAIIGLAFAAQGHVWIRETFVKEIVMNSTIGLTTSFSGYASNLVAKSMNVDIYCPDFASPASVTGGASLPRNSLISAEYLQRIRCITVLTLLPMELSLRMWQGVPNSATLATAAARLGKIDCSPLVATITDANGTIISGPSDADRAIYTKCQADADAAFADTQSGKAIGGAQSQIEAKAASAHWLLGSAVGDLFKALLFVAGLIAVFVIYGALLASSIGMQLGFVFQMALMVFLSPVIFGAFISQSLKPAAVKLGGKFIGQMVAVFFLMLSLNISALLIGESIQLSAGIGMGTFTTQEGTVVDLADAKYNGTTGVIARIDIEQKSLGFSPTAYNMSFGSGFGNNGFVILILGGALSLILIPMTRTFAAEVLQYGENVTREGAQIFKSAVGPATGAAGLGIGAAGVVAAKGLGYAGKLGGAAAAGVTNMRGPDLERAQERMAEAGKKVSAEARGEGGDGGGGGPSADGSGPKAPSPLPVNPGGSSSGTNSAGGASNSTDSTRGQNPPINALDQRLTSQAGISASQAKSLSSAEMSSWASEAHDNPVMLRNYGSAQALRGDMPGAVKSWASAASMGDQEAARNLNVAGNSALMAGNATQAATIFKAGAEAGDPTALNNLGALTYSGVGVAKDQKLGKEMMYDAARAGDPQAKMNMGLATAGGGGGAPAAASYFKNGSKALEMIANKATDGVVGVVSHSLSLAEVDPGYFQKSANATRAGLDKIASVGRASGASSATIAAQQAAFRQSMAEREAANRALRDSSAFNGDVSGLQRTDL